MKAKLHDSYSEDQLRAVLGFLKEKYFNLYLCAMIMYGCFLRPHLEIRLLKLKHFNEDFSQINLSGAENKNARVRTVYVPNYLQKELQDLLKNVQSREASIFTQDDQLVFNDDYFKTQ